MVVAGDDALAHRLAAELRGVYGERVTLVVPPTQRSVGPPRGGGARGPGAGPRGGSVGDPGGPRRPHPSTTGPPSTPSPLRWPTPR
ncbi:hypothetical protein ACFXDI_27550, partial [Streptomyces mirabilis]